MSKKSLVKNYFYNLAYQILVLLLPLITVPYVSRTLGAENIGIYSYTLSITTYFIMFGSLGVSLYGQREIAFCQDDRQRYSRTFYELILLRAVTLLISTIIFYLVFVLGNNNYNIYYKILVLEIIGSALDISWFFRGLEEFKKTVVRNTIIKLSSVASIFLFVKSREDLPIYILIYALSILIGNLSLWLYLPKLLDRVKFKQLDIKRHLKPTIGIFIPEIAVQVYTVLDKTMIGTIVADKSEVGYYEQAQKIIKLLLTIITSMGTVMMPRIASIFAKGNQEKIKNYIHNSLGIVFLIGIPIILGLCVISDSFVPIFFGEGFEKVSILIKIISPVILFIGISNVTGTQYLLPTKQQKGYTLSIITGATANFSLNMLFIPSYGAIGASIATILAELSVVIVQLCYTHGKINIFNIIKQSYTYPLAGTIMFLVGHIIQTILGPGLKTMIIQIIVCSSIYVSILIITKDELFRKLLKKISIKLHRRKIINN